MLPSSLEEFGGLGVVASLDSPHWAPWRDALDAPFSACYNGVFLWSGRTDCEAFFLAVFNQYILDRATHFHLIADNQWNQAVIGRYQ